MSIALVTKPLAIAFSLVLSALHLVGLPQTPLDELFKTTCETVPQKVWTAQMAKTYAFGQMKFYGWNRSEYRALVKLWNKESHWRAEAYNKSKDRYTGKNAGGIPQILGLDPTSPAPHQIERGLDYIQHRYGKPSVAWAHHRHHGWY